MSTGTGEKILIVEDDPGVAELQRRSLKRVGYEVLTAGTADEALRRVAEGGVRLIVLDYRLPGGMTGLDVHKKLQEASYNLPVILVTGFSDEATAIQALRAGVRDFVSKSPAYLDYLPEAVAKVLHQVRNEESLEALRQQLLQAQKLEAIGRLAGGIAHDFNNMLTVILGYSEAILDQIEAHDPLRADAEEIRQAATRSAALTRQLLAFSRQQVARPQLTDLNSVVSNLQKMLQRVLGEDVDLVTRLKAKPAHVLVDVGQIEQVVMNLAVNARDAMPDGGRLTIETVTIESDEARAARHADIALGRYVALVVSDTGCGMDAETQAHMFEPFFTTKPVGQGTGLGLATVYGIVRQSRGQIFVDSEPGRGTTFTIYLPIVEADCDSAAPQTQTLPKSTGSEVILIVEDQDAVRALAGRILRQHGYFVLEARDPNEALRVLDPLTGSVDLLLVDVVLPGQSGTDLAECLQAAYPDLKVLLMSGYFGERLSRCDFRNSGAPILQKPFTARKLLANVRAALDGTAFVASNDPEVTAPARMTAD